MSTGLIQTNKNWLKWARESVYYDKKSVANQMRIKEETLNKWEETGELKYESLEKLSKIYKISPFMFFNYYDPIPEKPIQDFRSINNEPVKISPDIAFELRNAKFKRENLLSIEEEDESFTIPISIFKDKKCTEKSKCIKLLSSILEMSNAKRMEYTLNDWILKVEKLGVLVFQFYNIPPEDLRGYAIYYDKLPIIGINHRESDVAKKFTLFHELAHLLLKQEGLSNFSSYYLKDNMEVKCNAIAAEILLPSNNVEHWKKDNNIENFHNPVSINDLAKKYKVSKEVVVRKFLILNYISQKEYKEYKEELNQFIFPQKNNTKQENGNQKYTNVNNKKFSVNPSKRKATKAMTENGNYYVNSLVHAYDNNILTDLELSDNFGESLDVINVIIEKVHEGE